MSRRPPNELEGQLHQAALSAPKKELTTKQAESIIPDPTKRQNALNFLLAVGLFKGLTTSTGQLVFRAVGKEEIAATKDLSGEENLVLSHIKSSGNEGIWTKHLKAKTSLHQTVIDRCLKTLTQKRLIKRVQSVQHITRKIYMLEGLEPSISLTGGPWYTDNELDTEFIHNLTEACYKLISDISFPKRRNSTNDRVLYPISNAPHYPTAEQIRNSLKKARLTETELTVEHVEMLLNVLVLDGKIERLPAFGSALWNIDTVQDKSDKESQDENTKSKRKRKKRGDNDESSDRRTKKKKKFISSSSDEGGGGSSRKRSSKRKRVKGKDDDSDSESDNRTKRRKSVSSDEPGADDQPRKKRKRSAPSDDSSSSESESESKRRKSSKATKRDRSSSPIGNSLFEGVGGGSVYRALREAPSSSLGLMEAPCGPCPSFEFCKDAGPVNPQECIYYSEWLSGQTLATER